MAIKLEYRHETPTLTDSEGGVWWPTREAEERINAAGDYEAGGSWDAQERVALAEEAAGNGTWKQ